MAGWGGARGALAGVMVSALSSCVAVLGEYRIDDDVAPNDLYPAERWLQAWRGLALAGAEADAAQALRRGAAWVHATARDHVSEPFRDSFMRANAVNQQILRAAAALG